MALLPIILAAGQGTRMNSSLPKVMHSIGAKSMLQHVIDSCQKLDSESIGVIVGYEAEQVKQSVTASNIKWVSQFEQKGTGHAVLQATDLMLDDDIIIIAYGDVPLIKTETLSKLAKKLDKAILTVLTTNLNKPFGYGRIIRDDASKIQYIVEEKDANTEEKNVTEVNTGFIAAKGIHLKRWLHQINPNNAQGEYYLTDCISMAVAEGGIVESVICENPLEVEGVNNRTQQAKLERAYQMEQAEKLMLAGVTLADPSRLDIRGTLSAGKDVFLDINTIIVGEVVLGNNVVIHPNCVIGNTVIGDNSIVKANSVIESAHIGMSCDIGPFARIRPGTVLHNEAKVGNFVEVKKSTIGCRSKISHLSYVGDTTMGDDVNIGAGTITCNYDGSNKFETIIGDHVFVGSDTQLVAPVTIANGSTIGAGSTITKDTPEDELTLSRSKQMTVKGWTRPVKNNKKDNT
ncbi:MAG: bifunctional UDP-N-acetylglucosamine pyrophosphorylase/glucosamine-1-phosphate N-acetyltransferase [Cocleimonas sp.]|jgi:bifunctional UDP-N-acetylglucosamine pyrophosphorylase/glucosamine-1-phosphate N-acetyltransferase